MGVPNACSEKHGLEQVGSDAQIDIHILERFEIFDAVAHGECWRDGEFFVIFEVEQICQT